MKYTIPLLLLFALASCKKKTLEPDSVKIISEYKLHYIYTNGLMTKEYKYNDKGVADQVVNYYYYKPFHGVGPLTTATVTDNYEYDKQLRVVKVYSGQPGASYQTYNYYGSSRYPATRYNSSYATPMEEFFYSGKLSVLKEYDVNNKLISTNSYYYNTIGNLTKMVIQYYPDTIGGTPGFLYTEKIVYDYLKYDNANNVAYAMPGINVLTKDVNVSTNNPLEWEQRIYSTGGGVNYYKQNTTYEYNSGNYPVRAITGNDTVTYTYDK
ncbi:MAG: hypothetical protein JST82_10270 [Bacteroidetes bacterium]|nr:hypothetical protein [Bacteroidota bacterium]